MQYEANRKTSDYTYSKFNELITKQNNTHYNSYGTENSANTAYFKHLNNIRSQLDVIDKSRVDAMIAVRMRATGYNKEDIEKTVKACAPKWQGVDTRKSWEDYAKRTAEYAFSYSGDANILKVMLKNEKYHKHWLRIEGKLQRVSKMNTELRKHKA